LYYNKKILELCPYDTGAPTLQCLLTYSRKVWERQTKEILNDSLIPKWLVHKNDIQYLYKHMLTNKPVMFHNFRSYTYGLHMTWVENETRAVTLHILNKSTSKPPGVQLYMLTNISIKFYDSRSYAFCGMHDTSWKLQILIYSKAITLQILNKSTIEIPGAPTHMLTNISVKFSWLGSNTLNKSRAITLQIFNKSTFEIPGAPLHMLTNIFAKFSWLGSNTFWTMQDRCWKIQSQGQ
jgi:hypothetical protein